jgi:hypothetical protein
MLKFLVLITVLLSSSAFAGPEEQMMSIKERLRLSLWVEGIQESKLAKNQADQQRVVLPEEIERALKKM